MEQQVLNDLKALSKSYLVFIDEVSITDSKELWKFFIKNKPLPPSLYRTEEYEYTVYEVETVWSQEGLTVQSWSWDKLYGDVNPQKEIIAFVSF